MSIRTRLTGLEYDRRVRIYNESRTDREAARRLGLKDSAFTRWRNREGWPAKNPRRGVAK